MPRGHTVSEWQSTHVDRMLNVLCALSHSVALPIQWSWKIKNWIDSKRIKDLNFKSEILLLDKNVGNILQNNGVSNTFLNGTLLAQASLEDQLGWLQGTKTWVHSKGNNQQSTRPREGRKPTPTTPQTQRTAEVNCQGNKTKDQRTG